MLNVPLSNDTEAPQLVIVKTKSCTLPRAAQVFQSIYILQQNNKSVSSPLLIVTILSMSSILPIFDIFRNYYHLIG